MKLPDGLLCAALLVASLHASSQPADPALAREVLRELVSIRTVHPGGDNTAAARAAARRLIEAGFDPADVQVLEPAPLKGNLVARLRGSGELKPILLLAHIDVVDALPESWSHGIDPWALTERDGFLYGRGVMDDKASAAMFVAVLARLKREGFRPRRDIILALTADEETGTHNGVAWLLKEHRSLIDAEFAINEGGNGTLRAGRRIRMGVQVSEKMYLSFELEASNPGGHSSLPRSDNAIYDLAAAIDRISRLQLPARVGPVVRAFAGATADDESGTLAQSLRAIAAGNPSEEDLRRASAVPRYNAQLRTTCVATRLEAGHADNALPQSAKATVNCRLLPGDTEPAIRAELQRAAGERVKVRAKNVLFSSEATDPGSPAMAAIAREAQSTWPGVKVIPVMSAGATDGSRLRNAGIPVYGVLPVFMEDGDWMRMHGRDERVPVAAFDEALGYFDRLIRTLSAGP
jgi:acetylornithine deacetylase/succinyl-diaminopimelate desuccinylase-like protein